MTTRAVLPAILALGVMLAACQPPAQQAAAFTEDAVRMPPNEPLHVGRAAAEEIDARGDLAYARGSYWLAPPSTM